MDNELGNVTEEIFNDVMLSLDNTETEQAGSFSSSSDDTDLPFEDRFVTEEQKQRDTEVTRLLQAYVETYENKVKVSKWYRGCIFYPCINTIFLLYSNTKNKYKNNRFGSIYYCMYIIHLLNYWYINNYHQILFP